jgi:agmatine deiminase
MLRRLPAEWEPQDAIQVTFPHADSDWAPILEEVIPCFTEIIETISRYQKVIVVCRDINEVSSLLQNANLNNLRLFSIPSNDTWARDHGGITIEEDGEHLMLDCIFNGWGLKFPADKDNLIIDHLFRQKAFRINRMIKTGLVLEGGGIESDGLGTILTTAECQLSPNRNPQYDKTEVEGRLKFWLGAERVLWLHHGYLAGDDTDSHIDTLVRFCNPGTIAYVRCTDEDDEHYAELKSMELELQAFTKTNGDHYRLVPLPMPDACFDEQGNRLPATYANFLIINEAVLVPTYGVSQDAEALKILSGCFYDRKIIGINCLPLILQHGSLHCITMQYPAGTVI